MSMYMYSIINKESYEDNNNVFISGHLLFQNFICCCLFPKQSQTACIIFWVTNYMGNNNKSPNRDNPKVATAANKGGQIIAALFTAFYWQQCQDSDNWPLNKGWPVMLTGGSLTEVQLYLFSNTGFVIQISGPWNMTLCFSSQ